MNITWYEYSKFSFCFPSWLSDRNGLFATMFYKLLPYWIFSIKQWNDGLCNEFPLHRIALTWVQESSFWLCWSLEDDKKHNKTQLSFISWFAWAPKNIKYSKRKKKPLGNIDFIHLLPTMPLYHCYPWNHCLAWGSLW